MRRRTPKAPYSGVTVEILETKHIQSLGKAFPLYEYLVNGQTGADGIVRYGQGLTYRAIADELAGESADRFPEVTLRRWMARLRGLGYIRTLTLTRESVGMRIWIINQKKFATPAPQLGFPFGPEVVRGKHVHKSVEKQRSTGVLDRSKVIGGSDQKRSRNTYIQTTEQKQRTEADGDESPSHVENLLESSIAIANLAREKALRTATPMSSRQLDERRRLLLEQAEAMQKKFKVSC